MIHSKTIAEIISYLLSPVTNAFYVILSITFLRLHPSSGLDFLIYIVIPIIFLCIIPVIGILVYTKKGVIDIWVSKRKTRTPFYLMAIIGYFTGILIFNLLNIHEFFVLTLAYFWVTVVLTITNLKTKMSSHLGGLTGPLSAILYLYGIPTLILFILVPVLMWARLKLNAHSMPQLIGGALIGIIVTLSTYSVVY